MTDGRKKCALNTTAKIFECSFIFAAKITVPCKHHSHVYSAV